MKRGFTHLTLVGLIAGTLGAAHAQAAPCDKNSTQSQLSACIHQQYQREGLRLQQHIQAIERLLTKHAKAHLAFTTAQNKWGAFREAECAFQTSSTVGASMQTMMRNACLADLTEKRANDLQNMLVCNEHADNPCELPLN